MPDCPREALAPGDRLRGRVITRLLGRGATSVVYELRDARGMNYALKVCTATAPEAIRDALVRFHRAARICRSLRSIHVPRIHAVGTFADQTPYMLMDRVSGHGLELRLRSGPLPIAESIEIARQLLEALAAVHAAGVIHRDVKPANVMISAAGIVRLLDFGICRPIDGPDVERCSDEDFTEASAAVTRQGTIVGTPHYMAPEQVANAPLDARADVYAAGVVLYEMLTGRLPFYGTPRDVLSAILRDDILPPRLFRADVPSEVERVVVRALSRLRAARYPDARTFQHALESAAHAAGYVTGPGAIAGLGRPPVPAGPVDVRGDHGTR